MHIHEFLGADREDDTTWRFALGTALHGAFGGAFGGVLAACCLVAARELAPGRVPAALDCRFVRGLPAGIASVTANLLHGGRSLSNISIDVCDENGKLATRSMVSLVEPGALRQLHVPTAEPDDWTPFDDAQPWPAVAPIVATLDARSVGSGDRGLATAVRVPWDGTDSSAEAACLAADISVGQPIGATLSAAGAPPRAPNPDLSVRFCGDVVTSHVIGVSRTHRVDAGVMALSIEVWSGTDLVALGVSSALVLGGS